jgi:hypothetical protein
MVECDTCHNLYDRMALHWIGDDNDGSLECPDCEKADYDAKVQEGCELEWDEVQRLRRSGEML